MSTGGIKIRWKMLRLVKIDMADSRAAVFLRSFRFGDEAI
jgi:hypothetical protein